MRTIRNVCFWSMFIVIFIPFYKIKAQFQQPLAPLTIAQELFMYNDDIYTHWFDSDAQNCVIWDENYETTHKYKSDHFEAEPGSGENKGWDFVTSQQPYGDKGVIAFSLYKISVEGTNDYIYMDYRDRDYIQPNGAGEGDVRLHYEGNGVWWAKAEGHSGKNISNHDTIGIWAIFDRGKPNRNVFKVPINLSNNFSGGKIKWNDKLYTTPHEDNVVLFSNNTFAADTPQKIGGKVYGFRKWSDNNTSVSRPLDDDGCHYEYSFTANFWNAYMSGPTYLDPYEVGTFTANPSGGVTPYDYTWYRMELGGGPEPLSGGVEPLRPPSGVWIHLSQFDGSRTATSSGVYPGFKMRVDVEDHEGSVVTVEKTVSVGIGGLKKELSKENSEKPLPTEFALFPNYPNPFNPITKISYSIAEESKVTLSVYNVLGEKIKSLVNDFQATGSYSVFWDGRDENGKSLSGGVYVYRLEAVPISGKEPFTAIGKMVLTK